MQKCKVQPKRNNNDVFTVQFNELTRGEVIALINALRIARAVSPVADDLSSYLNNGFHEMEKNPRIPPKGDFGEAVKYQMESAKDFIKTLGEDIGLNVVKAEPKKEQ